MPYGDKKSYSFFKMKGSPHKLGTIEGTSAFKKKIWPPTKGDNTLEYQEKLKESNAKLIAEQKAKYKAGKITKKELDAAIKEINQYVDF
tara:strand:- start:20 stop:286 length:267 start_codon:yes stop_codon:yes gene_type:complete